MLFRVVEDRRQQEAIHHAVTTRFRRIDSRGSILQFEQQLLAGRLLLGELVLDLPHLVLIQRESELMLQDVQTLEEFPQLARPSLELFAHRRQLAGSERV
ncbi:MAG TPA: hypothetical protein DCQ98_19450 [Planctomycetaceae bacterium]|nr:hypothetical protein [Planctomycetaceae bacterium]